MIIKKKKIYLIISVFFISFIIFLMPGIIDYLEYEQVASAVGGMPWQGGGTITLVREPCILDTPANAPTTCAISCPLVTSVWGPACIGYIEIDTNPQLVMEDGEIKEIDKAQLAGLGAGATFIAAPIGFIYRGGGTHPVAGMQYLVGGASNAQPWVIGIPGATAMKIKKVVDWFDYAIAGFND
jgi:hypothetical protein